jgi:hypothetical protein
MPEGTIPCERVKWGVGCSNIPTLTVVWAVPIVVEVVEVVVVVGGTTTKVPFRPAAAWPRTVEQ